MSARICRDCDFAAHGDADREADDSGAGGASCPACGSARLVHHAELAMLTLAHLDCDAFYASVEQRDDPSLRGLPLIVGGRRRGVVLAASYEARRFGVRSAMPMFKALAACPQAVVVRPDMDKYRRAGTLVRRLMRDVTPLVEPLSIDEAFLDLAGVPGMPAAAAAALARRIEAEAGITVSIGLSCNKFLAKIASDLDKPRGFAVIGRTEAAAFLASRPVGLVWGVGPAMCRRLADDGILTIGDLQRRSAVDLVAGYGRFGERLARLARGEDDRRVVPERPVKSISAETTFDADLDGLDPLKRALWRLCKRVAGRLGERGASASTVTVKLKRTDFRLATRSRTVEGALQGAVDIYAVALRLLEPAVDGTRYRLIGVGVSGIATGTAPAADLFSAARSAGARTNGAGIATASPQQRGSGSASSCSSR
ncbi:MAG: DNA polymerase IV [Alphaproteobacteria bacterium]